jgi:sugar phosphate isomerase/epimerase
MAAKNSSISIILYGLRFSSLPYVEKLRKLRDIGYRSIQGGIQPGMTDAEHRALLDSLDMEMSCLASDLNGVESDPGKYINCCRVFDCDEIMIGAMPVECRSDYDGYMRAIDRINAAGRALSHDGAVLGYHNHAQEFRRFPNGKTGMDLLFENLDPQATRFMLDTHWVQAGGGDILWWIERCEGRMRCLHAKDYRVAPANFATSISETHKQFAQVGEGGLPWRSIVDTALRAGVKSFIVEQDFTYGEDPYECAAMSYRTLKACGLN